MGNRDGVERALEGVDTDGVVGIDGVDVVIFGSLTGTGVTLERGARVLPLVHQTKANCSFVDSTVTE